MSVDVYYDCCVCSKQHSFDRDEPICPKCYEAKESEVDSLEEQIDNQDSEISDANAEIERLRELVLQLKTIINSCSICGGTLAAQNL